MQYGGGAHIGVLDGDQIAGLTGQHAEEGVGDEQQSVLPMAEDGKDLLFLREKRIAKQNQARQRHADGGQQAAVNVGVGIEVLADGAGDAPEGAGRQGHGDAQRLQAAGRDGCGLHRTLLL